MIKYYTHQTPPPTLAEPKSELPDECRQSDNVPLSSLIERFLVQGAKYSEYMGAQALSAEEKEKLFNHEDVEDLAEMDLVDQKAFIDNVVDSVSKKEKEQPTQTEKQAEPEKQPETAENA